MALHNDFGKQAEEMAAHYLEKNGYTILERNYRFRKAEIDLICQKETEIIFVEVKARGMNSLIAPIEAVNKTKINLYLQAADAFLQEKDLEASIRFDILGIQPIEGRCQIEHFIDAFDATTLFL